MNHFRNIQWNAANIVRLIIAIVLGFGINIIPQCRTSKKSGAIVNFRPPAAAFGIVWTILYILFGLSWILAANTPNELNSPVIIDVFYGIITVLLALWIVVYSCMGNKKGGIYVIATCIGVIVLTLNVASVVSRLMITPLLTWLILALLLNIFEVQLIK